MKDPLTTITSILTAIATMLVAFGVIDLETANSVVENIIVAIGAVLSIISFFAQDPAALKKE